MIMTIARRTERMLKRSKRVIVMRDLPSLAEAMKPRIPVKKKTSPPMIPSPNDHSYLNTKLSHEQHHIIRIRLSVLLQIR